MKDLLSQICDLEIDEIKKLNGYDNENFIVETQDKKYILKTYAYSVEIEKFVRFETDVLLKIQQDNFYPIPIPFNNNVYVKVLNYKGKNLIVRMLSFLEGEFLGNVAINDDLTISLGKFLANLDLKLQGKENDTIKSRKWQWDLQYFLLNEKFLKYVDNEQDKLVLQGFIEQYKINVLPKLKYLSMSLIHNDANEWNVLTSNDKVSGIIDFGDMCYSHRINEIAIAIAYTSMLSGDLIKTAKLLLKSYNEIIPLSEIEISVLYYLITARLVTSIVNSAKSKFKNPANEYATISQKPALKLIKNILQINPLYAENEFRKIVNL